MPVQSIFSFLFGGRKPEWQEIEGQGLAAAAAYSNIQQRASMR
jgi:hypothetical protein